MDSLVDAIRLGNAICVTDGSYKNDMGTAAFAIYPALHPDAEVFTSVNHTPGFPSDLNAYRAELGGLYGSIATGNLLAASYHLPSGSITLDCDCLSTIHNILKPTDPPPKTASYDLLMGIRQLFRDTTQTWHFRHVAGHQDAHQAYASLDRWEQINVISPNWTAISWSKLQSNNISELH